MWCFQFKELPPRDSIPLPLSLEIPKLELKELPKELKYAFWGENESFSVVISSQLDPGQEKSLILWLKDNRSALGWTIANLKGISPTIFTHKIYLEDDAKPSHQM